MSRNTTTSSRRDFLRASLLTSAVFGAEPALSQTVTRKAAENKGRAKNVIFMVSDGMNIGALSLAKLYRGLVEEKKSHWLQLYRERAVVRCLAETYSANSIVTDSAAAASAWGGGQRINNGTINVTPDGKLLTPLQDKLQKQGIRTGLVSTATITHATPAGFAANVNSRGEEKEIAQQYLDRRVDVLLGGGQKFFSPELRGKFAAAGYDVADSRETLTKLDHSSFKPLLGLFSDGYHAFDIDRKNVPGLADTLPSLAEMARSALDRLQHASDGFFLMVEGARIDHAGHANDAAASIHDQLAFDDAVGVVLEFIAKNPDTLLVITTDHGCGGIQMNGVSASAEQGFVPGLYNATTPFFLRLKEFTRSTEWMKQNGVDGLSGPKLGEALKQYSGLTFTGDQLKSLQGLKLPATSDAFKQYTGVGWTSANHTSELVEFCALGPGSHLFSPYLWNYEVHNLLLRAMEVA
jgi:alkaline phosphatase